MIGYIKENNNRYIGLPGFLARGGNKAGLEMVMDADVMPGPLPAAEGCDARKAQ